MSTCPVPDFDSGTISSLLLTTNGHTIAHYLDMQLSSAFQPIYSFANHCPVGFEGLVRVSQQNGKSVPPVQLFNHIRNDREMIFLDRLCRSLHTHNYLEQAPDNAWLFLNVSPQVCVNGPRHSPFFTQLLESLAIPPHKIVVEIVENAIEDERALSEAIRYYKDLGCLVALDDFGAGHSNFNRIWNLKPDIVKMDRSITHHAAKDKSIRRSLPGLVSMLHETGSLVLMEGIQSESEAEVAMESNVDLLQGFLFGLPSANLQETARITPAKLCENFRNSKLNNELSQKQALSHYHKLFTTAALEIENGMILEQACAPLLDEDIIERCYLLDEDGFQSDATLLARTTKEQHDPRFLPLQETRCTSWYRRPYFQRAIAQPGIPQTSRPYLSLTGVNMCVTLSMAIYQRDKRAVLCCDLDWSEIEKCYSGPS